ncbi:TlpA family protein disulfide reductase [Bizionia sp. KMM 8389]
MKYIVCILVLLAWSCKEVSEKELDTDSVKSVSVNEKASDSLTIVDFEGLEPLLNKANTTTYVVNFWATWCGPCIKELPYFEKITSDYPADQVQVILVNLDFPHQYETKLKPYIEKHNLQSELIVLNDVDSNSWIPKVDASWSGAIPATLIYNSEKRAFYEQTFTYDALKTEIEQFLN